MKDICKHTYIVIGFSNKKNMAGFLYNYAYIFGLLLLLSVFDWHSVWYIHNPLAVVPSRNGLHLDQWMLHHARI